MAQITMKIIAGIDRPTSEIPTAVKGNIIWNAADDPAVQFNVARAEIQIDGLNPIHSDIGESFLEIQHVWADHYTFLATDALSEPDNYGRQISISNGIATYKAQSYTCSGDPNTEPPGSPNWMAAGLRYRAIQMDLSIHEQVDGNSVITHDIKNLTAIAPKCWLCRLFCFNF